MASCVVLRTEIIIDKKEFILKSIFSTEICVTKETYFLQEEEDTKLNYFMVKNMSDCCSNSMILSEIVVRPIACPGTANVHNTHSGQ